MIARQESKHRRFFALSAAIGVCVLALVGLSVAWSQHVIQRVSTCQKLVRVQVNAISRLNRVAAILRKAESLLESKKSLPVARFQQKWSTQHRRWSKRLKALSKGLRRNPSPAFVAMARDANQAYQALHKAAQTKVTPRWGVLHKMLRTNVEANRLLVRQSRLRLRDLSIELAMRWKQLNQYTFLTNVMAGTFALFFLFFLYTLYKQKLTDEALAASQARYETSALGAKDGLWSSHIRDQHMSFSARWKELLGLEDEVIGEHTDEWLSRVHPEDKAKAEEAWQSLLRGETDFSEVEHRVLHHQSGYRWMLWRGAASRQGQNPPHIAAGSMTDITGRDSFHDVLTALPNRAYLLQHLERMVHRAQRSSSFMFGVLFLDLDGFKQVNDTYGHRVGDELLMEVAHRLKECTRQNDLVARIAGDEFALCLDDLKDHSDATRVAKRITDAFSQPFHLPENVIHSRTSIGIAYSQGTPDETPSDLLDRADAAMYQAKQSGKGRFAFYNDALQEQIAERLQLEQELREAITKEEFRLLYQPIVEMKTEKIVGVEAFLRWQHPHRGELSPGVFLATLEQLHLIEEVDFMMLRQAEEQLKAWQEELSLCDRFFLCVNISSATFLKPSLVNFLQESQTSGLCLDLREETIRQASTLKRQSHALEASGVSLSIDDFGTGHFSLTQLHDLPIRHIKLDARWLEQLMREKPSLAQALLGLAKQMKLKLIAEGVETQAEWEQMLPLCELAQGYLIARPQPAQALQERLQSSQTKIKDSP